MSDNENPSSSEISEDDNPKKPGEDTQGQEGSSTSLPARLVDGLPPVLPILVSVQGPVFPGIMAPVPLGDERTRETLKQAASPFVGMVAARPEAEGKEPPLETHHLYQVGSVGRVMQTIQMPDGQPGVLVMVTRRMRICRFVKADAVLVAEVEYPEDVVRDPRELEALFRSLQHSFRELVELSPDIPEEVKELVNAVEEPAQLADFIAANLSRDLATRQGMLASFELEGRLRSALLMVEKDLDLARLGAKIRDEIRSKMEARQKEHYLREQMKAIRRELGEEVDQRQMDRDSYAEKIQQAGMPEDADKRARQELERLSLLPPEASEYHVIRNYLDWLVELPWSRESEQMLDINRAVRILDEDHHGLREVKDRIVEFLAVRKLKPDQRGAILCLVGPPGVGKTSLGKSVARATGREFYRISLGGMRDEAEIKGHRRTYVGAMPGKIIQGLHRAGTRNPVFMLDELDKISSDWRGDPASALLEVLDPAQNNTFEDLYLNLPFDLSEVMFIATANVAGNIPAPLLDRTELIRLPGYVPSEKRAIGQRYLLPRQLEYHGLDGDHLKVYARAMDAMVEQYTREAGVRQLERTIGRVCRKVAFKVAALPEGQEPQRVTLTQDNLVEYLGPRRNFRELAQWTRRPGVVVGMAWTPVGGEILFIEASSMPGRGNIQVTGKLGSVMNESARIAHSLVRSKAARYGISDDVFRTMDLHVHVPAGAVPKDGPSAGVAMVCVLLSLLWKGKGRAARARVAMTGEITLRGTVMPVGGLREKVIGAKRAGIKTIVVPGRNRPDIEEIAPEVVRGLKFVFVDDIDEAVEAVIGSI